MGRGQTHDRRPTTAAGFEALLRRLDRDADRAAAEYEQLRLALMKFFDWRGAWAPEECADDALDRLMEKLQSGISVDDVRRYAYGIARLVLLERLRRQAQSPIAEHPNLANLPAASSPETNDLRECFHTCLSGLPDEGRRLVLQYYMEHGHAKIKNRRQLARAAGISDTALRSRVQRIRDRLERCAQHCVAAAQTVGLERALRHASPVRDTVNEESSNAD